MKPRARFSRFVFADAGATVAFVLVLLVAVVAIVAPPLWSVVASTIDPTSPRQLPGAEHWLGTDELGRDLLLRSLVAARTSILYALGATAIAFGIGITVGLLAAVLGPAARRVVNSVVVTLIAFPGILLAILAATLFGRSGLAAMIGLGIAGAPQIARLTMNLVLTQAGSDMIAAARAVGIRGRRLMARYFLPNIADPIATLAILTVAGYLIAMASLSFIGLGVREPEFDWGLMLSGAMTNIYTSPWMIVAPGLAIVVTGVSVNVLGERIAAGLDPRARALVSRRGWLKRRSETAPADAADSVAAETDDAVLSIRYLHARTKADGTGLLHGISIGVRAGERLGIVGESGSGKSLTLSALANLLPVGVAAESTAHRLDGTEVDTEVGTEGEAHARLLADGVSMVFQDPLGSLNPMLTIGSIMRDRLRGQQLSRTEIRERSIAALEAVGIPVPAAALRRRPHELSGGQRQRVMIAMALLGRHTKVLLADEPTTALDVSVQAQIVRLLVEVTEQRGLALVFVSHDLALVAQLCDRIAVMKDGRIVEHGTAEQIVTNPRHPYTKLLLSATSPEFVDAEGPQ
ncbi:ABC-type dipeptide/oligopeptide/nickel transport system ATPase component/ABC-type dipeptide/oligopeptide/nickel transport system permease subunit [Kibdelosporangium banguiense]|uniref:ABC-type dipeptide/oligopeptide/nickel transport system ATPase component/ABC-type dipeptide/oligopeptide/nickel transport system permease subunit n=1 Tax=Kibdelosporangium banguiense TaxID=1365924 RepID=A0ABS4TYE4_9PSEU|nr:dipeptide/oligopeptide/nickel ABC transporter permease/ATP-binding protein [Kibdelosporangium banguiense]MBP2328961.1 ABC-type dipeptide/oligopeptide/nickel transport system ATPase component/ABC-type dipeptide/oligopeptide/nickel transport system permease subunit [Kibdelosporangium banguiense]